MSKLEPITKLMKIADVKSQLLRLVDEVNSNELRILIARDGVPVAALVREIREADEAKRRAREEDRR